MISPPVTNHKLYKPRKETNISAKSVIYDHQEQYVREGAEMANMKGNSN